MKARWISSSFRVKWSRLGIAVFVILIGCLCQPVIAQTIEKNRTDKLLIAGYGNNLTLKVNKHIKVKTSDSLIYKNPTGSTSNSLIFDTDTVLLSNMEWVKCSPRGRRIVAITSLSLVAMNAPGLGDLPLLWYQVQPGDNILVIRVIQGLIAGQYLMLVNGLITSFPRKYKRGRYEFSIIER